MASEMSYETRDRKGDLTDEPRTASQFPLSLKPKDLDGVARTRQWVLQGSVESGPARSILRRRESLQLSERGRVDQQGGSGPNLAMGTTDMSRAGSG